MEGPEVSARERILSRVRRAGEGRADPQAVAERLARPRQDAPVPLQGLQEGEARVAQFVAKAEAVDTSVSRIESPDDLPAALAEELRRRNLPAAIRTGRDSEFERDWGGIERTVGPGRLAEPATLSRARLASAETGTLLLASGPDNPVTLTFLGETHFVLLREGDIHAGYEDMWAAWRALGLDPRTVNLVTGPSRSADIGQTLQLGAHGPVSVHVFLSGR